MSSSEEITLYRPEYDSVRLIQSSPPSWMVEITLREKSLPHRTVELSFAKGEHKTPEMLTLNPRGTIPVLTDGDAVLWETLAILEYLDFAYPEPPLLGSDRRGRARALNRLHESAALKQKGMDLFAYLMGAAERDLDAERVQGALSRLKSELDRWETLYADAPWSAGESMSLADISVFAYVATSAYLGLQLEPSYPKLRSFYERMRERSSVRDTWPGTWQDSPLAILAR